MRFTFEAYGETLVNRQLERFAGRALDARPALSDIADQLIDNTRRRFDAQGNGTWPPLAPATVAAKARDGQDPRVLHATRELRHSLTRKGAPGMDLQVGHNFLVYGSNVPHARFHQSGTQNMPQRRPLQFTEAQKVKALKILQRFLVEG